MSTCAMLLGGQVWCWGMSGANGACAISPVLVFGSGTLAGSILRSIAAGTRHHCVVATVAIAACNDADSAECRASGDNLSAGSASLATSQRSVDSVW